MARQCFGTPTGPKNTEVLQRRHGTCPLTFPAHTTLAWSIQLALSSAMRKRNPDSLINEFW
jgi:hypothetical protein